MLEDPHARACGLALVVAARVIVGVAPLRLPPHLPVFATIAGLGLVFGDQPMPLAQLPGDVIAVGDGAPFPRADFDRAVAALEETPADEKGAEIVRRLRALHAARVLRVDMSHDAP